MGLTLNTSATNNADWKTQVDCIDAETDEAIDFTGASIKVEIKDKRCYSVLTISNDDDEVTVNATGFLILVKVDRMKNIRAGVYDIGAVYELGGETISIFTGTITIIDGIAKL